MQRVRFIHTLKSVSTPFIAKFAVFAGLIAFAGFFVSVPHIVRNMPSFFEIGSFFQFALVAFVNTKIVIQGITLATVGVSIWMLRDLLRVFRHASLSETAA